MEETPTTASDSTGPTYEDILHESFAPPDKDQGDAPDLISKLKAERDALKEALAKMTNSMLAEWRRADALKKENERLRYAAGQFEMTTRHINVAKIPAGHIIESERIIVTGEMIKIVRAALSASQNNNVRE